ncbi:MAG: hypothetical protein ACRDQW_11375, partial [Haloechinothrix sp.]
MNALAFALLAVALVPIGLWARRNADSLVPALLDESAERGRQRVIRRGGAACLTVAAAFGAFAIA